MVQRYNILGRYTNQYLCLCSRAWSVEVSHGKIRVRRQMVKVEKMGFDRSYNKHVWKILSVYLPMASNVDITI